MQFAKIFSLMLVLVTAGYLFFVQPKQDVGATDIGGDFTLTDQNGKTVTNDSLKAKLRLVYFGFTFCPDICPTALVVMGQAVKEIGEAAPQQVFITVDPARDTVEQLKQYAQNFPGLIALTGSAEEVKQAALAYKVYYEKQAAEAEKSSEQAEGTGEDSPAEYMINHSSFIYLMDKDGKYLAHFPHTIGAKALEEGIQQHLQP